MNDERKELIATKFNQGNPTAFAYIRRIFYPRLLQFTRELVNGDDEGQVITDRTFEKLERMHQQFNTMVNIKAFLYITSRNDALNYLKMRYKQQYRYVLIYTPLRLNPANKKYYFRKKRKDQ